MHCHSDISDGELSPQEIKEVYLKNGYSIVAYTDHEILLPHTDLNDQSFLALHGVELGVCEGGKHANDIKACHIGLIALEQDNLKQVCWNAGRYLFGNAPNYKEQAEVHPDEENYFRDYGAECVNHFIETGRKRGFFVTYNHPTWSLEDYPEYTSYHGMNAMEICNNDCLTMGFDEYNTRVYDDMLKNGERIYCIAADDNHNRYPETGNWDSCGAFTVINAEKLEYRTITKALENGEFYASLGPEIYDIWVEDGKIYTKTSPAAKILFSFNNRRGKAIIATDSNGVNEGFCEIFPETLYVRITVFGLDGKCAYSNAYFTDTLLD